jgi:hypothetical protein
MAVAQDNLEYHKLKIYNGLDYTVLVFYNAPYTCAHWVFAFKYWVIAYKMQRTEQNKSDAPEMWVDVFYYTLLFLNIATSISVSITWGKDIVNAINPVYELLISL